MSLVLSSIVPHPPILIPSIGKDNQAQLSNTTKAYKKIKENLLSKKVETILIISPHGAGQENAFVMNLSPEFEATLEEFGDFTTKKTWPGDIGLTYRIKEKLETKTPLQLATEQKLDHGLSIPLFLLTENLLNIKIIPLYFSGLSNQEHFDFGKMIGHELLFHNEQIAVIASGDLSHALTKDSPAGYSPKGKKFDKKLTDLLLENNTKDIIKMDEKLINEAKECGLKSILILLGILDEIKYKPNLLSYEAPFGVGYMVMDFEL